MATYNLVSGNTGDPKDSHSQNKLVTLEGYVDIANLTAAGNTIASGDIFNALTVPAGFLILNAGAEVMTAFDGTSPTVDVDFAGGDDIIDDGDVSVVGFLDDGTNGQSNFIRSTALSTYDEFVAVEDTIDVTLTVTGTPTVGVLRVYVNAIDCNEQGSYATEASRDVLG